METESLLLRHERIDDIPLLQGFLQNLGLPELLEHHLGSHHLHEGLANGVLATTWMAFILSESVHRWSKGEWPTRHSGAVLALPVPGETWARLNDSLIVGLRGLPGGSS